LGREEMALTSQRIGDDQVALALLDSQD